MAKLPLPSICLPFLLLFLSLPFKGKSQLPTEAPEQQILLKIKQDWGNPQVLLSWNTSNGPHCSWQGISCSGSSVTGISLSYFNITGKFPTTLCNLKNLTKVDLSWNYFSENFPTSLYNCTNLESLDLSQNSFIGEIPPDIYGISTLKYLSLSSNNFSGQIPAGIGRLTKLVDLYLHYNQLNGSLPAEIGNLINLENLGLANNPFTAVRIPPEFGQLKKLKFLWMRSINLIGEIPEAFENMAELQQLDLSKNQLSGKIPIGLFRLKNLMFVYLYYNRLSGEIPQSVDSLNLIEIDISMNELNGPIPEDFGKLKNLTLLFLYNNQLSGEIPVSIGTLPALSDIRLFKNSLTGVLPPELGFHSKLRDFEVSKNQLSGELPENLCRGGVLFGLVVFSNNLTGTVPESLSNCSSLSSVQLYRNRFSGTIPDGIWTSPNLDSLMIGENSFSGELPSILGPNLTRLQINNNRFSGNIPSKISYSENLTVFTASNNLFSGEIPLSLTALTNLQTLVLDGNQLSGQIPPKIFSWRSLSILNLSSNHLSSTIPLAIGSLRNLNSLDLSDNQLSGEIPPQLGYMRLSELNLSSNQLTGPIPTELQIPAYDTSFLNNPSLCSSSPYLNLRSCYSEKSSKISAPFIVVIIVLAGVISLVAVGFVFFAVKDSLPRKHRKDLATWKISYFHRIDFNESNIIQGLTEENMVGSGGFGKVYRIALGNRSREIVSVKKIWNNRNLDEELEKEFQAEVEILGKIRHSNIVKLWCCISNEDSKLLVYEYMEKGSLDRWLHSKNNRSMLSGSEQIRPLDWPKRLQIAIGAAQGLCYMHHSCTPPIVHRDVKSSNILLDSEFKARIADFGLARMLVRHGEPDTMSAIAGSFGYIAPEYGYTRKVGEKADVYSFGVVLLELATGREANNGDGENTCLTEWVWHNFQESDSITGVLDEEIKEPCHLDAMNTVLKVGLMCTGTLPSSRPTMKEVLQILLWCSPLKAYGSKKANIEFDIAPLLHNTSSLNMAPILHDKSSLFGNKGSRRSSKVDDSDDDIASIV
ncbi:uncharacterized protein LOC143852164 [Tasmannia lanceolata]|uniref:uncharacterized protein LOC143852164 n=1 Tax=Tasmannia lanceolata TaxID=3420 RepID=UPI004063F97F